MPAQSASGWAPARGWFYALVGLVIIETACLANTAWRRSPPAKFASTPRPSALLSTLPATSAPAPSQFSLLGSEGETLPPHPGRDSLTRALNTRSHLRRTHRFEELGASLARTDPRAALRLLPQLLPADGLALVRGAFDTLGQGDRHAAVAAASEIMQEPARLAALRTLLSVWQGNAEEPVGIRMIRGVKPGSEAGLGLQLLGRTPADPELALQWAQQLTQGAGKAAMLGGLAASLARTDPARAVALEAGLEGDDRLTFAQNLVASLPDDWVTEHPQEVLAWSQWLPDTHLRDAVGESVFSQWSQRDADAAAREAVNLPPGLARENILRTVAKDLAGRNTAAADRLAESLTGLEREIVAAAVDAQTPVGIGALLQPNEKGDLVIHSLMDNMPAALSGQIHPGDRVVGIVRADGFVVKTGNMDLTQVVNLIRGAPASAVQLQVARAQSGGGFAPPATITLIRQRITRG